METPDSPGKWKAGHRNYRTRGDRWFADVKLKDGKLVALMSCHSKYYSVELLASAGWENWEKDHAC